jgi:hypothetical protein
MLRFKITPHFRNIIVEKVKNAPDGYYVTIGEATRTQQMNAKLHAICSDVASKLQFLGEWKVLFISGHAFATGLGMTIVPGLEGEFVNIRESSAQMTIKRMCSLIEYINAYCAENDVKLTTKNYEE